MIKNTLSIFVVLVTLSACFGGVKDWDGTYSDLTDVGKKCTGAWLGYNDAAINMSNTIANLNIQVDKILILKLGVTYKNQYDFIALLSSTDKEYLLYNNPYSKKANINEIDGNVFAQIEPEIENFKILDKKIIQGNTYNSNHIYCQFYHYNDGENVTTAAYIGYFETTNKFRQILYKLRRENLDKDTQYETLSDSTDEEINAHKQKLEENLFFEIRDLNIKRNSRPESTTDR